MINTEYHSLSNLLRINEELGEQNRRLAARLEMINYFIQTIFSEGIDVVTLWKMSEIVSIIERLKNENEIDRVSRSDDD
jgi:hypothetical protein